MRAHIRDNKDWIQERAIELAEEEHDKDFYDLPRPIRDEIYKHASNDYVEVYSSYCDYVYEQMRDRKLWEVGNEESNNE